jgi:hypothetical protein
MTTLRYHEAAHAIVATVLGLNVDHVWVIPGERGETGFDPGHQEIDARARMLATLAGQDADQVALGDYGYRQRLAADEDDVWRDAATVARLEGRSIYAVLADARARSFQLVSRHWTEISALARSLEVSDDRLYGGECHAAIAKALKGRTWYRSASTAAPEPAAHPVAQPGRERRGLPFVWLPGTGKGRPYFVPTPLG